MLFIQQDVNPEDERCAHEKRTCGTSYDIFDTNVTRCLKTTITHQSLVTAL
jgi:hypothetical protein